MSKGIKKKMRIGILTYHRSHNYGAFLQAYALSHSLQEQFPESRVEIIDYDTKASHHEYIIRVVKTGRIPGIPYYIRQYGVFLKQLEKLPLSNKKIISDDFELFKKEFDNCYDLIVVGSDEVWVTNGMRGFPNAFWLPGKFSALKVSYAASSRSELTKMPLCQQEKVHHYLNDFRYIGARDEATITEVNKFLDNSKMAKFNPDPVFTWDFGDVRHQGQRILKEKFGVNKGDKTLGVMVTKKENAATIIEKARVFGFIPIALYKRQKNAQNAVLDPFEWIAVIAALNGIVTSFFHGVCFSIKYDTPFVAIEERKTSAERSKMHDLLNRIGCNDCFITEIGDVGEAINANIIGRYVNYSKAREELYNRFLCSIEELKESIK